MIKKLVEALNACKCAFVEEDKGISEGPPGARVDLIDIEILWC
jgi:hypothetical protein